MKQNTSFDINYAVMEVKDININYYNKSRVIDDYEYLAYRMLAEKIRYNNVSKLSIALVKLIESNNLSINALRIVTMLNAAQLTENTRKNIVDFINFHYDVFVGKYYQSGPYYNYREQGKTLNYANIVRLLLTEDFKFAESDLLNALLKDFEKNKQAETQK